MNIKLVYPAPDHKRQALERARAWGKWPFLAAAWLCPAINLFTGGKAWSVVVVWSLWMAWSIILSPHLVEYNRISQFVKLLVDACALLILIDRLLVPGWAVTVVPIVCFGGLLATGALFFSDLTRQKQNMMPMLWMTALSLLTATGWLTLWPDNRDWPVLLTGAVAAGLLIACCVILGKGMLREWKKRFHLR